MDSAQARKNGNSAQTQAQNPRIAFNVIPLSPTAGERAGHPRMGTAAIFVREEIETLSLFWTLVK
jgi:hypothetical protein